MIDWPLFVQAFFASNRSPMRRGLKSGLDRRVIPGALLRFKPLPDEERTEIASRGGGRARYSDRLQTAPR